MNIGNIVLERIKDKCESRAESVKLESLLVEDLGFDSLSLIDLCMSIEDEFNIELDDMDIVGILTVKNLVDASIKALNSIR